MLHECFKTTPIKTFNFWKKMKLFLQPHNDSLGRYLWDRLFRDFSTLFFNLPLFENPQSCRLDAVCGPGCIAIVITNRNRKTTKVCTDKVNHRPLFTFYFQSRSFTAILGSPLRTWNKFQFENLIIFIRLLQTDWLLNELFKTVLERRMQNFVKSPQS